MTKSTSLAASPPRLFIACRALLVWTLLLVCVVFFLHNETVPTASDRNIFLPAEFSAPRALATLPAIGLGQPHPTGSPELAAVRKQLEDRFRELGMQVNDEPVVAFERKDHALQIGMVSNIVARLPGSHPTSPILLMTHYDSTEHSSGAGSDAAGVVIILEALRALKSGPPLRNDLVILLTDGEVAGDLGLSATGQDETWLRRSGLILDLSSRGNGGVPLLYRTSDGNHRLLQAFAQEAPFPTASSFAYEFGDLVDTPSVFRDFHHLDGIPSLSLGMVGGSSTYRQATDTLGRLSAASVQQLGDNVLAVVRVQGNQDFSRHPLMLRRNEIFYNLFSRQLVHYRQRFVLPLVGFCLLGFCLLLRGNKGRTFRELCAFLEPLPAVVTLLLAAPFAMLCVYWCVDRLCPAALITPNMTAKLLFLLAFLGWGTLATASVYLRVRRRYALSSLVKAALTLDAILLADLTLGYPASSFLLFWPWVLAVLMYLVVFRVFSISRGKGMAIVDATPNPFTANLRFLLEGVLALLPIIPALLLLPFVFYLLFQVITLDTPLIVFCGLLVGVILVTFLPMLENLIPPTFGWRGPALIGIVANALMIAGYLTRSPSAAYPLPTSLFYAVNAETQKAAWVSFDDPLFFPQDSWAQQKLTHRPVRSRMPDFLGGYNSSVFWSPAPYTEDASKQVKGPDAE